MPICSTDVLALGDHMWPILVAKPKSQAHSTPSNSDTLVLVKSSKSRAKRSLRLRSSETLKLSNKIQALDSMGGPVGLQFDDLPSAAQALTPELVGGPSGACFDPATLCLQCSVAALAAKDSNAGLLPSPGRSADPQCLLSAPLWSGT